jgi:exonuclease SbcC
VARQTEKDRAEHHALLVVGLAEVSLPDTSALEALSIEEPRRKALVAQREAEERELGAAQAVAKLLAGQAAVLEAARPEAALGADLDREAALEWASQLADEARGQRQEGADLQARLDLDDRTRDRNRELNEELVVRGKAAGLWQRLHELIGRNDGGAFQRFAQILNLAELIVGANAHLARLSDRYELTSARDDEGRPSLAFAVIDHYQGSIVRPVSTLSGGETFLVSMALALALGQFRSVRMPIETLLLDEGFGTLDRDTQDVAMDALGRLQDSGIQVGIISHVEGLRERIPAQVLVEVQGDGRSSIRVV